MNFGALILSEHTITVPLVWPGIAPQKKPDDRTIEVFARIATKQGNEDKPYLLFLQGGPGSEDPRPGPLQPAWMDVALERFQLVLLDQRGTGRSTPVGDGWLKERSARDAAEYLTHHRADAIVRDAEAMREHLGIQKWSVLGQSFGGFTLLNYLSTSPTSVEQAFFTGGLSAVGRSIDEVYTATYAQMRDLSLAYYRRFPTDREKLRALVALAERGAIILPSGERVSPSRIRNLGHLLGSDHGWSRLHWLLELDPASNAFVYDLADSLSYGGRNPLYFVLHESCYVDGGVSAWAAERVEPEDFKADASFLTAEHPRSQWLDTVPALEPWAEVTRILAHHEWPRLYDEAALEGSGARGAAAVYVNDAYVPLSYSRETVALMPGVVPWITSEYEHSGVRTSGTRVLERLFDLADGRVLR